MKKVKMNMMTMTMKKMVNKDPLLKSSLKGLVLMVPKIHSAETTVTRILGLECSVSAGTLETNGQAYRKQSNFHRQDVLRWNYSPQQKIQSDYSSQLD